MAAAASASLMPRDRRRDGAGRRGRLGGSEEGHGGVGLGGQADAEDVAQHVAVLPLAPHLPALPALADEGLELLMAAIKASGHAATCKIGMDVAASEFPVGKTGKGESPSYDLKKKQTPNDGSGRLDGDGAAPLVETLESLRDAAR